MSDRITYCDVIDKCADCPKYGDDCDGDKRNDDLISRTDVIEAVRKELVCDGRHEAHDKTCRFIADVLLSALPSADRPTKVIAEIKVDTEDVLKRIKEEYEITDRPHGEWIEQTTYEMICSVCDAHWDYCDNDCARFNYCPNCGARMIPYKGGDDTTGESL